MGLLSMLPNSEETDKSEFGWWERRFPTQRTITATTGVTDSNPFRAADGSTALTDAGSGVTLTADTEYSVKVADTAQFKATHVIEIRNVNLQASVVVNITGVVTGVLSATVLKFRPNQTYTGVGNDASPSNLGLTVSIKGTANQEGAKSGSGIFQIPINPTNRTQIFRSAFSLTRTALKGGLLFDKSGPYNMMAKENGMRHMIEMEKAFLFGENHEVLVTDPETGEQTPETQTGGVIWFLQQWEKAASIYRGSSSSLLTDNADPDKRIINSGGSLTKADYNRYLANLFRVTQDKGYEKVCLCGAQFITVINTLFDRDRIVQTAFTEPSTKARFVVYSHETLFGTVHYKTHPLFTQDPDLTASGLFLDLGNLRHRPLSDSDTKFLKGRQANDRDGRKDEWITEAGLEMKFPESCMLLNNVQVAG